MVCLDCYWKGILPILLQDKGGIKLWKPVQKFGQKNNEKETSDNIPKKKSGWEGSSTLHNNDFYKIPRLLNENFKLPTFVTNKKSQVTLNKIRRHKC